MAEFNWEINKVNSIHFCGAIFLSISFFFFKNYLLDSEGLKIAVIQAPQSDRIMAIWN